ncbi:MAG: superoxide dismutase [Bacteroidia bacterium]
MNTRRNFVKTSVFAGIAACMPKINLKAEPNHIFGSTQNDIKPVNGKFELPPLGYAFNALEPHIDAKTMEIHYTKHHQAYINKLNETLESHPQLKTMPLEIMLRDLMALPESARNVVRNHGGGHWNHNFLWQMLKTGTKPGTKTMGMITTTWGDFEQFKSAFEKAAIGVFGSGWAWVIVNRFGALEITTTPNQDNPIMNVAEKRGKPVLGIDVWEHAYYLKHQNKRADYISAYWNVINWNFVESNIG